MLAEGFGPETVTMAVVGIAGETDVAGTGDELFDGTEISMQFWICVDADDAVLKCTAEIKGHFFFDDLVEGDRLDLALEAFLGALGQLATHASGVDAAAFDLGQSENREYFGLHRCECFVTKFQAKAVPHDVTNLFPDIDDTKVVFTGDINPDVKWILASVEIAERLHTEGTLATGKHFVIDEGDVVVAGNAAIFLKPMLLVEAALAAPEDEVFAGIARASFLVDLFDKASADGAVNVNAMRRPAHGIAAVLYVANDLVEHGIGAAVR